ncbi:MAG: F0F1 ATP synthase subunit A [Longimicrobiaceae bacterium]
MSGARQGEGVQLPDQHAGDHGDGVDMMHHIMDSREWETPLGTVHFPEPGSWTLGALDLTPTKHVLFIWLAAALVLLVFLGAGQAAKRRQGNDLPKRRHNAIEALVLFFRDQVVLPNVGARGEKFVPFVTTLFFFILFANLMGLVPWGSTATANISVTGALAVISMIVIEGAGMRELGPKGYLGTIFFVPAGMNKVGGVAMAIFMAPIELMGKFAKPFALAIRLMANMTAGHVVLLALISLIFVFGSYWIVPGPIVMAVAITFLEIFVAFLQAFVFALLTAVFIGLIRSHH